MPASQARTISADARHARVQRAALLTGAAPAPREAEETAVADELIAPVVADDTRATQGGDWISKLSRYVARRQGVDDATVARLQAEMPDERGEA